MVERVKKIPGTSLLLLNIIALIFQWLVLTSICTPLELTFFLGVIFFLWHQWHRTEKLSYCMSVIAMSFGGLGMIIGHFNLSLAHFFNARAISSQHGHHVPSIAGEVSALEFQLQDAMQVVEHWGWMIGFCFVACNLVCKRYSFKCSICDLHWSLHLCAMLPMCLGMWALMSVASLLSLSPSLSFFFSLAGMTCGTWLAYRALELGYEYRQRRGGHL
ncbi:hypothetical protein [Aliikangiella sp. G2MR2-5]|uniref:hypothetical protein n=1 Tax=Aliikangiella sp. G2MR2-5 TaxID=2788943 RepID=UPI0018AB81E6|nr:hypothetical protein [Aliikangiella sp. G2MR2-5]